MKLCYRNLTFNLTLLYFLLSDVILIELFVIFKSQAKYIAQCIEEIKQELRQDNVAVKANAVAKLTYVSFVQISSTQV